ncbi:MULTISPECIES: hypothetical protein [Moraxella]|jgi:hypothetical protein|uniref:DUF2281 domain-containing protein n=2 Tax=Moraxella TaxID=475 RepID=A0A1B8Q6I2_MORLA|nr:MULTISPECIES: hypothetical protein [Moraxella]MBE9578794.1 hypothetical protein [Moraxella sp. K1664]MBE9588060.1 hypothetical protein [Moraxella sp. K1630]MBE9596198.1 hypothetical protein [Moraxella sp. K2450]MDH9218586.1 hypothetical protein [Moraxella lacunata]MDI4483447.1 hypothetical protein [Moraxella lacunata]
MQTQPIQNINQVIGYIQSLPINRQQKMIDWINVFQSEIEKDEMNANQNFFELWQNWHDKSEMFLDDDNSWADTKDRNDIGREVSFE